MRRPTTGDLINIVFDRPVYGARVVPPWGPGAGPSPMFPAGYSGVWVSGPGGWCGRAEFTFLCKGNGRVYDSAGGLVGRWRHAPQHEKDLATFLQRG